VGVEDDLGDVAGVEGTVRVPLVLRVDRNGDGRVADACEDVRDLPQVRPAVRVPDDAAGRSLEREPDAGHVERGRQQPFVRGRTGSAR